MLIKAAKIVVGLMPLSCFFLSAAASTSGLYKNFELSAAIGPSWSQPDDTTVVISPYETDNVVVQHVASTPAWKLGVGYHFFANQLQQRTFFNDLLVEVNFYRSSETIEGDVWQFQFNNFDFSAPITSTRLMLDAKPCLFTFKHISFYPIVGAGIAWNSSAYNETVTRASPGSNFLLNANTKSSFAYELGAGIRFDITPHLQTSLEYLYANLGNIVMSSQTTNDVALTFPPQFKLSSQMVMLGLNWNI